MKGGTLSLALAAATALAQPHDLLSIRADSSHTEKLSINPNNGVWSFPAKLGTPPQDITFAVSFESGSILVVSKDACGDSPCNNTSPAVQPFDTTQSTSFDRLTRLGAMVTWNQTSLPGSAGMDAGYPWGGGYEAKENVTLYEGAKALSTRIKVSIRSSDQDLLNDGVSGLFGLSTVTDNLVGVGTKENPGNGQGSWLSLTEGWEEPVVGLRLVRSYGDYQAANGTISFGQYEDGAIVAPPTTWHPASNWTLNLTGVSVNGAPVDTTSTLLDPPGNSSVSPPASGTMHLSRRRGIALPAALFMATIKALNGSLVWGQWIVPCESTAVVSLHFGDAKYDLQPVDWHGSTRANGVECTEGQRRATNLVIAGGDRGVLGESFLRGFYTVLKAGVGGEGDVVGFAQLTEAAQGEKGDGSDVAPEAATGGAEASAAQRRTVAAGLVAWSMVACLAVSML